MGDTDGITMSDDELLELYGYINAAGERHTHRVQSIVPGYIGFALDCDVIVQVRRLVVRKNTYYLATPEHAEEIGALDAEASTLWVFDFSKELERMAAALENGNLDEGAQGGKFTFAIRSVQAQDGKPITYEEVMTWAAIHDAMDAGDVDKAKRITKLAYPNIRFTDEPDEPAAIEAIRPTAHIVSNSKPALVLDSPSLYDSDGAALNVGSRRKGRGAQLQIQFKLESGEGLPQETSREDVAVLDAIQTLKGAGNTVITPWQIAENMGYNPTPELVDEIHGRVLHLMGTLGTIDWSQQAKDWGIVDKETGLPLEEAKIISQLAQLTVLDTTDAGGNRSIRYRIDGDTLTYQHANEVNQVIRYPPELLEMKPIDIDGKVRMRSTLDQKRIQRAVLWWVYVLKGKGNKMADSIHYEKLWAHDGYAPKNNSARKRAVTHTHDVLRALKACGEIEGFEPVCEGRAHRQTQVRVIVGKQRRRLK